jgi:hypothetical protein
VSSRIRIIGLDMREGLLRDSQEMHHLGRLGATLGCERRFPRLSRILIRLEFAFCIEFDLENASKMVYRAFPWVSIRPGILVVERLPFERNQGVRELTDDCHSTVMLSRATVTF